MKRICIVIVCVFLKTLLLISQTTPPPYTVPGGVNLSSGNDLQSAKSVIVGAGGYNVTTAGASIVEGSDYVQVLPGYEVTNLTSGNAWLRVNTDIPGVASFHPNGFSGIAKYDRFEIGVNIPLTIQNQINNFIQNGVGINPYDRDQIKVECTFTNLGNGQQYTRNAFYKAHDISVNPQQVNQWIVDPPPNYPFRIRFAPPLAGNWRARVNVSINNIPASSPLAYFNFNVVASNNPGHLRMATSTNPYVLKMQFESGQLFYGVGRNITDAKHDYSNNPCGLSWDEVKSSPVTHNEHRGAIADLGNNGGNFVRIRLNRWGVPIEEAPPCSVKNGELPDVNYLTNYHENEQYMWEMDKTLALCESQGIYILLTLLYDPDFKMTGDGNWKKNPYSALLISLLGPGAERDEFFMNPTAINTFKKRLDYIEARWGYSTNIAAWEMINETENMQNNGTRLAPYPNSPWNATTASRVSVWLDDMKNYLKSPSIYPKHLVTNVGVNLPPGYADTQDHYSINWTPPSSTSLDFLVDHAYISEMGEYPANSGTYRHSSSAITPLAISSYYTRYWPFPLPINTPAPRKGNLIGEFGLADHIPLWKFHRHSALTFHNQNWGSIFSNGLSVSLQLFFESIEDPNDGGPITTPSSYLNPFHKQYNAIRKFTDRIDFNTRLLPDMNFSDAPWRPNDYTSYNDDLSNVNTFWMKTSGLDTIYGWTQNATANFMADGWGVATYSTDVLPSMISEFNYSAPNPPTANVSNSSKLTILHGLLPLTNYNIRFFDAWDPAGNELTNLNMVVQSDLFGMLRFGLNMNYLPPQTTPADTYPDYAFIATKSEHASRTDQSDSDLVLSEVDESEMVSNEINTSNLSNSTNASTGVNEPETTSVNSQQVNIETVRNSADYVYPVPATDRINLVLSKKWKLSEVTITNELGLEVRKPIDSNYSVDVSDLPNGFYLMRIRKGNLQKIFKIVVEH